MIYLLNLLLCYLQTMNLVGDMLNMYLLQLNLYTNQIMADHQVEIFTKQMTELLAMDREAELEENAEVLAQFSFKVSETRYLTLKSMTGTGEAEQGNHETLHQARLHWNLRKNTRPFESRYKQTDECS